ncbi:hypothetical protein C8Q76DRAFT_637108, partial [Earliella scabrosa]
MFGLYRFWKAGDLRQVARVHNIRLVARDTKTSIREKLLSHSCAHTCPVTLLTFTTLRVARTEEQIVRAVLDNERSLRIDEPSEAYLREADQSLRDAIIREWQDCMSTANLRQVVCAPCARYAKEADVHLLHPSQFDLRLLRNDNLPSRVRPRTYDFDLYQRALLCPQGMTCTRELAPIRLCAECYKELIEKGRMPKLSLANSLYYGQDALPDHVAAALRRSSQFDRLLVARARGSRISYRFTELKQKRSGLDPDDVAAYDQATAQRFVKGNIIVLPQNSTQLNSVLPPSPSVIRDTVCAVFVGSKRPSKETIRKLSPVLATKSTVKTIIEFLVSNNPHYARDTEFHGFSQRNLDLLFEEEDRNSDEGLPCAMSVGFLEDSEVIRGVAADYSRRNEETDHPQPDAEILMENVGYTSGDDSPIAYRDMKMKAIDHCLNRGRFIQSQSGDRFIPDFENPSLLTWLFPHLDPWGIGGFHDPHRRRPLSMEEQLKYLLSTAGSPFERDADFAFVYFNILQKKQVCDSVRFKVKASQQRTVVQNLLAVDKTLLARLIDTFKHNPNYVPQTVEERELLNLVNRLGTVLHDLPGTSGYKIKLRNEIRALVNHTGTPAFFVTLNPSDVHNPVVRVLCGHNISLEDATVGEPLAEWERKLLVARRPAACAKFFHLMISGFIDIILRYGKAGRGLLG